MFDYKKFLEENDFENNKIEAYRYDDEVEIFGTKKELLYFASCLIDFVLDDLDKFNEAELNFDKGADLTDESTTVRFFLKKEDYK